MPTALRRGLPRRAGGEPWPPSDAVGAAAQAPSAPAPPLVEEHAASAPPLVEEHAASAPPLVEEHAEGARLETTPQPAAPRAPQPTGTALRRGLPRHPSGEPWPPAASAPPLVEEHAEGARLETTPQPTPGFETRAAAPRAPQPAGTAFRRGLPRQPGGAPWPPAVAAALPLVEERAEGARLETTAQPTPGFETSAAAPHAPQPAGVQTPAPAPQAPQPTATPAATSRPAAPAAKPAATAAPAQPTSSAGRTYGPYAPAQWIGTGIIVAVALVCVALLLVAIVRGMLSLPALQDFLKTYPGTSPLPDTAPVGIPAWLAWQHFCNVFLMVLIIRSGLQVRMQKRPPAYWTPKKRGHKVSITVWLHQSLDLLWLVNGVIFVVLLFSTGQWMRLVPTSWTVFPNAVSATLQYLSMNWPTENGWVDYNALQQLFYFATVFLAAPLAIVTGYRMSGLWPSNAKRLTAAYPVQWARRVHFPVMLYFVAFIMVHVTLVFSTGALRNLDHMYAAKGSTNPNAYTDDWTGFWWFAASLVVIAAAWIAARPTIIAPVARLFGTVSSR